MAALIPKIAPFLNKLIPAGIALKGLSKINPKLSSFISNAASVGYSTDSILDYLRKKTSEDYHQEAGRSLRPDEINSAKNFDPSQNRKAAAAVTGGIAGIASAIGGEKQNQESNQSIHPDEIKQMNDNPPKMIPGRRQLQITEQPLPNVPKEGSVIAPPISGKQQSDAKKITSLQRFNQYKKKQSMMDQETQRFEQQYGQKQNPQGNIDQMILAGLEKILQM